jgi:hypothetical protein
MASYSIIDTVRTHCPSPGAPAQSHVSGVVLDRGGAYLVTDIYDFMDHGHTFAAAAAEEQQAPVSRARCRHCGRPTLALATISAGGVQPNGEQPTTVPLIAQTVRNGRRRRGAVLAQNVDNLSVS